MSDVQQRIDSLVKSNKVVLFMKGSPAAPQCGFSATVVGILGQYLPDYETFNVLSDPDVRNGIKEYSDWPTIPQLYVDGEFVGGCDIVREMDESGELVEALGDAVELPDPPNITVTDAAAATFRAALEDSDEGDVVRLSINEAFQNDLAIGPARKVDVVVEANGIKLAFDPPSARRAEGLSIDYVETPQSGFKMDNPQAPAKVESVSPAEVKAMLDAGEDFWFLDVRTPSEAETASIDGAKLLTKEVFTEVMALPKDTKLVLHCHHGMRSFQAAEHFTQQGFKNVHNMAGGIDAWSSLVDDSVPKY
ncbi:MAG: Grx4 family monothiol glutaredoxin [Myxococcota bacterium]